MKCMKKPKVYWVAGLCEGIVTSPKDMINNYANYAARTVKSKVKILKQSILNALPYSFINSFYDGLVVSPYYQV